MAEYIRTMTQLRQQLRNMGAEHAIMDADMAYLLLMGVAMTHHELLEQFDLPTRQGNPPTLQQVTNALRSRDERDRMVNMVAGAVMGMTGGSGNNFRSGAGNGWKNDGGNWHNNGGGGNRPNGSGGSGPNGGTGGGKKPIKKCYYFKKAGHLLAL
ncbi:hypothetical protein PR003_g5668 [Phytophthora rubi]|uniref:Uncharacterized protein n=1 Tax=Phytophthora rubi TaxID=129364 RepID=A0A6A4FIY8_9STRA|nr:hypothetical protein PR002_g16182 [Phytophthora rubi]KAE9349831.1 hypothetical protein PR003_g5668 [Phytophthora rubi]